MLRPLPVIIVSDAVDLDPRCNAVREEDIFHIPAAFSGRLHFQSIVRAGEIAVPELHVPDTARHLASDRKTVPVMDLTVKNTDMFGGDRNHISLRILAGFDGNSVIPRKELRAEKDAVRRRIRIPAVAVPDVL